LPEIAGIAKESNLKTTEGHQFRRLFGNFGYLWQLSRE
jgi:hypothetical protein